MRPCGCAKPIVRIAHRSGGRDCGGGDEPRCLSCRVDHRFFRKVSPRCRMLVLSPACRSHPVSPSRSLLTNPPSSTSSFAGPRASTPAGSLLKLPNPAPAPIAARSPTPSSIALPMPWRRRCARSSPRNAWSPSFSREPPRTAQSRRARHVHLRSRHGGDGSVPFSGHGDRRRPTRP